jgi:phenylacetate-CoA ligase
LTTGDYLDRYRKKYVEQVFDTKIFDVYDSTESGPIAFQCCQENYHMNSDFVHVGLIENNELFYEGTGEIVITRLFGGGTPIIRYRGLGDIISIEDKKCSCGLPTGIIKAIHGRKEFRITMPNGEKKWSSTLQDILFRTMYELGTNKIFRAQIIQNTINQIIILLKIDEKLRYSDPPVTTLISRLKENYSRALHPAVSVTVKEVEDIDTDTPFIITNIDE